MKRYIVAALIVLTMLGSSLPKQAFADQEQLSKSEKKQLFRQGASLWPVYCGRCHAARPGAEFSPEQWQTIMMHMRSVSEMPAKDSRALEEFLKARH